LVNNFTNMMFDISVMTANTGSQLDVIF